MSTVSCLASGEAEQTFQGPVFITVCKFLLKSITSVNKLQTIGATISEKRAAFTLRNKSCNNKLY